MRAAWRVLLVEDNPADVFLVLRAFEEAYAPAKLFGACDGDEALHLLADATPDLLLLDLRLPGACGLELLARVRRMPQHRHLPIVVLTSSPAEADRHACLALGADRFVTKPSTFEELVGFVRELVDRYRTRH
jgi:CheY-like chemotaxis protein